MANIYKINAAGGLRIPVMSADPASPENGLMWYNSSDNVFKIYEDGVTAAFNSPEFASDMFKVFDAANSSKKMEFDVSAVAASTTRKITMPDADVDLGAISTISGDVSTLQSDLDTAEGNIATLQSDLDTAEGNISTLQSDLDTAEGNISTLQSDLDTAEGNIATLQSDLDTAEGNISTLQSDLDTAEGNISTLQSDLDTAEGNIATLQSDLDTAEGNISTLQSDLDTAEGNISTLQSDVSTLQSDLDTAEGNISTLQSDLDTAEGNISTLQSDLDTAEGNIATLQSDLDTAEGNISTLQSDLDTAEGNISTLQSDLDTAEGNISTLQSDVSNLDSDKVDGAASSTDSAVALFDGATGKVVKNSVVTIDSSGNVLGVNDLTAQGNVVVEGDLTVQGTLTALETTNTEIKDANILLNKGDASGANANGSGLSVERGSAGADASLVWDEANDRFKMGLVGSEVDIADVSSSQSFSNKTIDADFNTVSNLADGNIAADAGIDASKLADGSVSNAEFQYLSNVSSDIQSQLDDKASLALDNLASVAINASLVADSDNALDVGSAANNWKDVHAKAMKSSSELTLDADADAVGDRAENLVALHKVFKRGKQSSGLVEEEYVDSVTLNNNSSASVSAFRFQESAYSAVKIEYLMRDFASPYNARVGSLIVITDGTNTSISDSFTEIQDIGVTWSAAVVSGYVEISYTTTNNGQNRTMRADIKRFKAI